MSPVDLLAVAMWPLAATGLWLGYKALALSPKNLRRHLITVASRVLLVGPFLTLTVFFPHHSATVLALEYSIVAVFGVMVLVAVWRVEMTRWRSLVGVAVGFLLLGWGVWHLGGDFLMRRARVEGHVSDKQYEKRSPTCSRCIRDHFVYLGGRRYRATAEVFRTVETGQRIRAKVGRASRRILWFEARPF